MAKDKNNSPNTNAPHLTAIRGNAISMAGHIEALIPKNSEQHNTKMEALEFLNLFSREQLKHCQDVFE